MTSFLVENTKTFMFKLLKSDMFDNFEVRSVIITTFTTFEIHCDYNNDFFNDIIDEEKENRKICLWKDIKSYVFDIIKGNNMPQNIKIVFCLDKKSIEKICQNSSAMFLNILFENKTLKIITGFSQREFDIDKSGEYEWDKYVKKFLYNNNIISTQY